MGGRPAPGLAAALHVFASVEAFDLVEYPAAGSDLSQRIGEPPIRRNAAGRVCAPETPGLGMKPALSVAQQYLRPVTISVDGQPVFGTAAL